MKTHKILFAILLFALVQVNAQSLSNQKNQNGVPKSELMAFMQMPEVKIFRDYTTVDIEKDAVIESENADTPAKFDGTGKKYEYFFVSHLYSDAVTDHTNESFKANTVVTFIIEEDGSVADIKILQPINKEVDRDILRVFKKLPKFIPAKNQGKFIKCKVIVPIRYDIEGLPKKTELIMDPICN